PPPYSVHPQDKRLSTSTSEPVYASTKLQLNPTNFLYIDGNYPRIKSTFMINPSLHIPETYLPLLKDINADAVGERMNMYVDTGDDLDLDVWIVGRKESDVALDPMRRTRMRLGSWNGSLTVKVNAIDNIHPFSLELVSRDKPVTVFIPRSFHGTVMLSKRGKCTLSDEIFRNLTVLGAVGKKEMSFVGDFSPVVSGSGTGLVEWAPDELRAETEGDIMVKYVDEVE
ncbi:hypothetical protein SCLCIDRAFT_78610, partial [Scleroderma citrinum Foug A]